MEGVSARAAKTSARLVTDFEPGMTTVEFTEFFPLKGAGQSDSREMLLWLTARAYRRSCTGAVGFNSQLNPPVMCLVIAENYE